VNDNPIGDTEPIDWQATAARQQQHNIALIRTALGDVGDLDQREHQFIAQIAWDGGHRELASLLRKARQAPPIAPAGQPDGLDPWAAADHVGVDARLRSCSVGGVHSGLASGDPEWTVCARPANGSRSASAYGDD
jgi:hypothetical protein